jgi:hypothetical protein
MIDDFDDIVETYGNVQPVPVGSSGAPAWIRRPRHTVQHFVKVPLTWKDRLAEAKYAATLKLALHLLFEHWKRNGAAIKLPNVVLDRISPDQKLRALRELEQLGLVVVERRDRKSPTVTLLKF